MTQAPTILGEGEAREHLAAIAGLVARTGGGFHNGLVLDARTDELAVRSTTAHPTPERYAAVPIAAMPLMRDFAFRIEGDSLHGAQEGACPAEQAEMMGRLLALYNACNKLAGWRRQSPLLALADRTDVLSHLLAARAGASKVKRYRDFVEAGEWDALALTSFFNARFFSIREEDVRRVGRTDISGPSNTILPIVDCFNHSHAGEPFAVVDEIDPVAVAVNAAPSPSGELFVRYNVYDPLETVLFYGFFDASADWLGSVPFAHELPGGRRLLVTGDGGTYRGTLSPAMRPLRSILPHTSHDGTGTYRISKLVLPGRRQPDALRRVARVLLGSMDLSGPALEREVARLERATLDVNRGYWEHFAALAATVPETLPAGADLGRLTRFALALLDAYRPRP